MKPVRVFLVHGDIQVICLGLAKLSIERPDRRTFIEGLATRFNRKYYDEMYNLYRPVYQLEL